MDVDFGFQKVKPDEKWRRVQSIFHQVASRYDVMNDLMSGGLHRLWKRQVISLMNPQPNDSIVDVAGGTGDISQRLLAFYPYLNLKIQVVDPTPAMMEEGRRKLVDAGLTQPVSWLGGRAEHLPLPSESVHRYVIAFGLRNVADRAEALKEAFRVLKPGGQWTCLELSPLEPSVLGKVYDFYSFQVIPRLGDCIAQDREAYEYLVESIRRFPKPETLCEEIQAAGFAHLSYHCLTGGIATIHQGYKP